MVILSIILVIVGGLVSGILAALSGSGAPKYLRRFIMPGITTVAGVIATFNPLAILLFTRSLFISAGYGIPDSTDDGSSLGKFWMGLVSNPRIAGILTRASLGIGEAIATVPIPFITGEWVPWAICGVFLVTSWVISEVRKDEGMIRIFGWELSMEEIILHGTNSAMIMTLIITSVGKGGYNSL
uniref:Uncharacterized protein n=1 Tax=viral metagenome TaxID=1070528 RepID=A0A6M3K6S1_9ZZZZ